MKKKWIISAGVALALGALATVAVAERGGKMREHRQPAMRMLEHLDLTDGQKEQLQAVREKHREAMREQRETMAAMGKEQREAVMNILTDEQQEAMKEMRSKRGKFFGQRGWGGKGRHDMRRGGKDHDMRRGGQGAFSRLDLTDEQKEQLVELRKEQRTEMRESRQKHRTALENVLTDEQREKLEKMKDEAFYGGRRWRGKR
jgi:Spy/CpxP family protein refolding chaperone